MEENEKALPLEKLDREDFVLDLELKAKILEN